MAIDALAVCFSLRPHTWTFVQVGLKFANQLWGWILAALRLVKELPR
jgi:hypothetical protein